MEDHEMWHVPQDFMSVRDSFAEAALPAVITQVYDVVRRTGNFVEIPREVAIRSYQIAEAMLAERGRK